MKIIQKPDFQWKWHTSSDVLVLSDFARYLVFFNHQLQEGDNGFKNAYKQYFSPILNDYKNKKITNLRHGTKLATYIFELEQYLPKNTENGCEFDENKAFILFEKLKYYLIVYDDGLINAEDMIVGLRRLL